MQNRFEEILTVQTKRYNSWEEAASDTVDKIFKFETNCGFSMLRDIISDINNVIGHNVYIKEHSFDVSDQMSLLRSIIDYYAENKLYLADPANMRHTTSTQTIHQAIQANEAMFLILAHCAISLFEELKLEPEYSKFLNVNISSEYIKSTVIRKQHDYGPNNVSKFGLFGLLIRMHDKVARLENLFSPKRKGNAVVNDESIFDTLTDIVGYTTVTLMWLYGDFLLPMEMDKNG